MCLNSISSLIFRECNFWAIFIKLTIVKAKEGWCKNRCALAMKQWVVLKQGAKSKTDNFWTGNHTWAYQYTKILLDLQK